MPTDGLTVRAAVVDRAQEDERRRDAAELRAIARRENGVNLSVVIPAKNEAAQHRLGARAPAGVRRRGRARRRPLDRRHGGGRAAGSARHPVVTDGGPARAPRCAPASRRPRGDFIVMIDADGSMDPREIELFVQALRDRRSQARRRLLVKGSRFTARRRHDRHEPRAPAGQPRAAQARQPALRRPVHRPLLRDDAPSAATS